MTCDLSLSKSKSESIFTIYRLAAKGCERVKISPCKLPYVHSKLRFKYLYSQCRIQWRIQDFPGGGADKEGGGAEV